MSVIEGGSEKHDCQGCDCGDCISERADLRDEMDRLKLEDGNYAPASHRGGELVDKAGE